jgi:hypothetical protein
VFHRDWFGFGNDSGNFGWYLRDKPADNQQA